MAALFTVIKDNVKKTTEKGIYAAIKVPIIVPEDGSFAVQVVDREGWIPRSQVDEYGHINQKWLTDLYDNPFFQGKRSKKKEEQTQEEQKEVEPTEYVEF